jgi:hypothetical protein
MCIEKSEHQAFMIIKNPFNTSKFRFADIRAVNIPFQYMKFRGTMK